MTANQAKWTQTLGVALVGVLTDAAIQFQAAGDTDLGRSAVVAIVVGGSARLLGAWLATQVTRP